MKHNFIFGLVYTVVYFSIAILAVNAEGTGPVIFLTPVLTWILVLIALFLSKRLDGLRNRVFFGLILFTHYAVTACLIIGFWGDQYDRLVRMARYDLWFIRAVTGWYLLGQLYIWCSLFREGTNKEIKEQLF